MASNNHIKIDPEFESNLKKAEENVAALDAVDRWQNRRISTIYAALECGLRRPETNAQYEALVMLRYWLREEKAVQA